MSTTTPIQILGVNDPGREAANGEICDGRDLPWLQDVVERNVWVLWQADYTDVIVLDAENHPLDVFNVSDKRIDEDWNYAELKELLANAAQE